MATITTEWQQPTREELLQQFLHPHQSRLRNGLILGLLGLIPLIVGFAVGEPPIAIIGGAVVGGCFADVIMLRHSISRMLDDPRNASWFSEGMSIIDEEKIIFVSADGLRVEVPWKLIRRVETVGPDYALYLSRYGVFFVRRRSMTEEQWPQFSEWAEHRKGVAPRNLLNSG